MNNYFPFVRNALISISVIFILGSCSVKKISRDFVKGATSELSSDSTKFKMDIFIDRFVTTLTDSLNKEKLDKIPVERLSKKLLTGLEEGLNDSVFQIKIDSFFKTITVKGDSTLDVLIEGLLDSVATKKLADSLSALLIYTLKDNSVQLTLKNILPTILKNPKVKNSLRTLLKGVFDDALTNQKLEEMKLTLLGPSPRDSINFLADTLAGTILTKLKNGLGEGGTLSPLQEWVEEILGIIGLLGLLAGFLIYIWRQRVLKQKEQETSLAQILMKEIHDMPNQDAYDDLTKRIQHSTRTQNLEAMLRKRLADNGMLGLENWQKELNK